MSDSTAAQLSLGNVLETGKQTAQSIEPVVADQAAARDLDEGQDNIARRRIRLAPQTAELAPMMRHYLKLKEEHPQHLLLYQVGDFYEIFFEDAKIASAVLGIRLTARHKDQPDPVPMCGVPVHAVENYVPRLLKAGFSCVILSQVGDAQNKKGMMAREISRIVTPGVRFEGDGLDETQFNYLAAVCLNTRQQGAVSYVDVSTGHLRLQPVETSEELVEVLRRIRPTEILLPGSLFTLPAERGERWLREAKRVAQDLNCRVVTRPFVDVTREELSVRLNDLLPPGDAALRSQALGMVQDLDREGLASLAVILDYVREVSFGHMPRLSHLSVEERTAAVFIDAATRRNLELTETRIDGQRKNSLLGHIDYTRTAMGSRLLADWLLSPSTNLEQIEARLDCVGELCAKGEALENLREKLCGIRDIDRLTSRITGNRATPRDFMALRESLESLPAIDKSLKGLDSPLFSALAQQFDALEDVAQRLISALVDDPPNKITEGGIFRDGYHAEIDRLRRIHTEGRHWLAALENRERQRTGIAGLKVRFNNVFGYFIEVTKANLHKVPSDYERRQTLTNAERFITRELKDYEVSLLSAKARQIDLERELFLELREWLSAQSGRIQLTARLLAMLDVLSALSHLASKHNYCRPQLGDGLKMRVVGGRHPVVERVLGEHNFVANDVLLDGAERRFAVLTGPNMGGKSTYLRQVGLIQLLAQAGSYVPAQSAELGLVDRIFTRIGAADDLARGDSTFMVEMREAAAIVKKATSRSLVLIDEVGRGTATTDGLAIAEAIAEWLHDRIGCRTVFATHFHELTELARTKPGVFCLSVGVIERDLDIIFTHRIEEKAADRSYGIEVARLAGLPESLLQRAETLIEQGEARLPAVNDAEGMGRAERMGSRKGGEGSDIPQLLIERIKDYHPNSMTPLQALHELIALKRLLDKDREEI